MHLHSFDQLLKCSDWASPTEPFAYQHTTLEVHVLALNISWTLTIVLYGIAAKLAQFKLAHTLNFVMSRSVFTDGQLQPRSTCKRDLVH